MANKGTSGYWARKQGVVKRPVKVPGEEVDQAKEAARRFSDGTTKPRVPQQNVRVRRKTPPLAATKLLDDSAPLPEVLSVGQVSYRINDYPQVQTSHEIVVSKAACTPIVAERMALLLASGVTQRVAGAAMGINQAVMLEWNRRGQRDIEAGVTSIYSNWWNTMLMAKASCEANWIARLNEGSVTDWRAAAFMLERRFGVRWAPKAPKEKLPEASDVSSKSTEELQVMLRQLLSGNTALPTLPAPVEPPGNGEPESATTSE